VCVCVCVCVCVWLISRRPVQLPKDVAPILDDDLMMKYVSVYTDFCFVFSTSRILQTLINANGKLIV
jgi:hypothetical protein